MVSSSEKVDSEIGSKEINDQADARKKSIGFLSRDTVRRQQNEIASVILLDAKLGNISSWEKLYRELEKLKGILDDAAKSSQHQLVVSQFETAISQLFSELIKVDNTATKGDDDSQAMLLECLNIYAKSVAKLNGSSSPRVQNAGMASMALSYLLAVNKDPVVFEGHGLYIEHFKHLAKYKEAIFSPQDKDVLEQRKELLSFYKRINEKKDELFNFETASICADDITKSSYSEDPEIKLFNAVIAKQGRVKADEEARIDTSIRDQNYLLDFTKLSLENKYRASLFFSAKGYPENIKHIEYLKRTALTAFTLFSPGKMNLQSYGEYNRISPSKGDNIDYNSSDFSWASGDYNAASYQKLTQGDYPIDCEKYTSSSQHAHEYQAIRRENEIRVDELSGGINEMDCVLAEPQAQTGLLLKLIEGNLSKLSDSQWRTEIEVLIFKTYQDRYDNTVSPFYEQNKLDNKLIAKMDRLTNLCYEKCIGKSSSKPEWEAMLFVLRLRANFLFAKKQDDLEIDASSKECNAKMLDWLEKYELEIEQKIINEIALSANRLKLEKELRELRIARSGLLLGIPHKDLSTKQVVQLFNDMVEINSEAETFTQLECRAFLRECQHRFLICQKDLQSLLKDSDLVITNKKKVFGKTPIEITPAFNRLFGKKQFDVIRTAENTITFNDGSNWGEIEIVGQSDSGIYRYIIVDGSREKFHYIHPNTDSTKSQDANVYFKEELQVNNALLWDHAFWVRVPMDEKENKAGIAQELRIYSLANGKECLFKTTENGRLLNCTEQSLVLTCRQKRIARL